MTVQIARWQFTRADYHRMREIGILTEDDRVELIDGEVRAMGPIGPIHAAIVKRLNAVLSQRLGTTAIVSVQDPVQLSDNSEPQPDIAILWPDDSFYAQNHPSPQDILLIIEVADTSVVYDRDEKLPRYAQAGIQEVWLVDVNTESVEQYTHPRNNQYGTKQTFERGNDIQATTINALTISVDQIFG